MQWKINTGGRIWSMWLEQWNTFFFFTLHTYPQVFLSVQPWISGYEHHRSVQHCGSVCFCCFVSPVCPLNDCCHHAPDQHIRLIHGPFLVLEVVNSSEHMLACSFVIVLLSGCQTGWGEAGCLRIDETRCFMNRSFAPHKVNFPKEHPTIFQSTHFTERERV